MSKKVKHIMVDIESTGINPGCRVWQIGAVTDTGEKFIATANMLIGLDRNTCHPRDNPDTIRWQETVNAYNWFPSLEFVNGEDTNTEGTILSQFQAWLNFLEVDKNTQYWSQGNFDFPILNEAFSINGFAAPWHYRQINDSRTIFNWYGVKVQKDGQSHNALVDACRQMELLAHCKCTYLPNVSTSEGI